jgi:hypothetical protein
LKSIADKPSIRFLVSPHNLKGTVIMVGNRRAHWIVLGLGMCGFIAGQAVATDVYQGTAKFRNAEGKQVATKVTITLEKTMPDVNRRAAVEKIRSNPASAKSVLTSYPQLGTIEAENRSVPIRFVYVTSLVDGQKITVISDEPLGFIGGAKKDAKSKEGFDLTYAMLTLSTEGESKGEMGPATKVKWMESGAPAPERYDNKIVWIEGLTKTTKP